MAHQWLSGILNEADLQGIEAKIKELEHETLAEIVVCIVKRSVPTGTLFSLLFLLFGTLLLSALLLSPLHWHPAIDVALSVALALLGARLLYHRAFIIRFLTPAADLASLTFQRALLEFYQSDIKKTERSTGVLVFISLAEHTIHVLADRAINAQFAQDQWDKMVARLIHGIKTHTLRQAFIESLEELSPKLKAAFPVTVENRNELPDHVLIKEA